MDAFFALVIGLICGLFLGLTLASSINKSREKLIQQAVDRGYMVQCLGRAGYYWECEE